MTKTRDCHALFESCRCVHTQKASARLHRLHNGSRPFIGANRFISRVELAPFRTGCGLSKRLQSRRLVTVFSVQAVHLPWFRHGSGIASHKRGDGRTTVG